MKDKIRQFNKINFNYKFDFDLSEEENFLISKYFNSPDDEFEKYYNMLDGNDSKDKFSVFFEKQWKGDNLKWSLINEDYDSITDTDIVDNIDIIIKYGKPHAIDYYYNNYCKYNPRVITKLLKLNLPCHDLNKNKIWELQSALNNENLTLAEELLNDYKNSHVISNYRYLCRSDESIKLFLNNRRSKNIDIINSIVHISLDLLKSIISFVERNEKIFRKCMFNCINNNRIDLLIFSINRNKYELNGYIPPNLGVFRLLYEHYGYIPADLHKFEKYNLLTLDYYYKNINKSYNIDEILDKGFKLSYIVESLDLRDSFCKIMVKIREKNDNQR